VQGLDFSLLLCKDKVSSKTVVDDPYYEGIVEI
jgi:hypothetical protein